MKIEDIFSVAGKVIVVTGGASGIGLTIARACAANGAKVAILDMNPTAIDAAIASLEGEVSGKVVDVTDRAALDRAFDEIEAEIGGIDVTFANAGISGGPGFRSPDGQAIEPGEIDHCADTDWDQLLAINLQGTRKTLAAAARVMKARGKGGRLIITSSAAGRTNVPFVSTAYHASKAATTHMGRQLAVELASHGILVNMMSPASFVTNINGGAMHLEPVKAVFAHSTLLGRVARDEEIAGLALFFASGASSYITGVDVPIDGGACLKGPF